MSIINNIVQISSPKPKYWILAIALGAAELFTYGTFMYVFRTSGEELSSLMTLASVGVLAAVGLTATYGGYRGEQVETAIVLALGPVAGLLVYLIGYSLVFPPATDSPTWLVFLVAVAMFVGTGLAGYRVGRAFRHASPDSPAGTTT